MAMSNGLTLIAVSVSLLFLGGAQSFQARATIISIDPEKRIAEVFAGGQRRVAKVANDAKILDETGKEIAEGLKSRKLEKAQVTLTVTRGEDGQPIIVEIRLGSIPESSPRIDTSSIKPLNELGKGTYNGVEGGLYPAGENKRPASHEAAGIALSRQVRPLDPDGKPDPAGKIVLLTIGMSNTSQASTAFKQLADADPDKNPHLFIVNGAQGGMTAAAIQDPDDQRTGTRYWDIVDERLRTAGVTRAQVQAVWIKQADAGPTQGFPGYARQLQSELARIVQILPGRFPNLKLTYLSGRTYGGYAQTRLNPEPYAYESGFSVKWLIEQQIKGDTSLNYNPAKGEVRAPWLSWGPYLWANGMTKRDDGFFYEQGDFAGDGTHESPSGQRKVGNLLLQFFKTDATTKEWFLRK